MTEQELRAGFTELEALAESEYHERLDRIAEDDPQRVLMRLGRLIGVAMKAPLASAEETDAPSTFTGAYRRWHLASQDLVEQASRTWQYRTLDALVKERARQGHVTSVYELAREAHHERGFFGFLANSARKYICGDPQIRKRVEENVESARRAGLNLSLNAPEVVVGSGGVALGGYLVSVVPILGFVGVPVIAGVVLLLYTIGVDAFCNWTAAATETVRQAETNS